MRSPKRSSRPFAVMSRRRPTGLKATASGSSCYRSEPPKRSESVLQGQPYLYADEIDKEDQAMMCIRELMDGTAHLGKAVSPTVIPLHMIWLEIAGKIANHLNERAEKKS